MKDYDINTLQDFCCGCGLCGYICGTNFSLENGFYKPNIEAGSVYKLNQVCPCATSRHFKERLPVEGEYIDVFLGWSKDKEIRNRASSGGVLTAIAIQMLEKKVVDGVLHIGPNLEAPWKTQLYCSRTKEDIISNCGSRYAQSLTLSSLGDYLDTNNKYLLIGKPCDIRALRNYSKIDNRIEERIPYMFSFFCMGTPSENANIELLKAMECEPENCISLRYRGDGWPGYTKVTSKNSEVMTMTYNESWGSILGRDLRKYCKFCMDGFGDAADISCGDAWYLDDKKRPSFTESEGRNVIFIRTKKGEALVKKYIGEDCVYFENFSPKLQELRYMQKSQYARKELMKYRQLAMQVMRKKGPRYPQRLLRSYSKNISIRVAFDAFAGTVSRIIKGKL